jgi:hypothetical protein
MAGRFASFTRGKRAADRKFSEIILHRFFANQLGQLQKCCFAHALEKPVERRDLTGQKFFTAAKASLNGKLIHVGDVLLYGKCSGIVTDLIADSDAKIFVWMKILLPMHADLSCSRWKITGDMTKQRAQDIGLRPTFWSFENGNELLCI